MLKLYTDINYVGEMYRRQIFPVLYDIIFQKNKQVLKYYQLVDTASESDIIVLPIDYASFIKEKVPFNALLKLSKSHNKPIWIYSGGDYGYSTEINNSFTFRLGGFHTKLSKTTHITPTFINDPYDTFLKKDFKVLEKENKPSIGFVGHAKSGVIKCGKEYIHYLKYRFKRSLKKLPIDKQNFYPSSTKRAKYLNDLALNSDLNTQFILRNHYRAGLSLEKTQDQSSQEFYTNIYDNAYTFCIRGVGNFSVRFYETLAVGRIPILLDTDCRLPLSQVINWSQHCLVLDTKSKISISEQILNFHNNLTTDNFRAIQYSNRELWLNKLCLHSYFIEVSKLFKSNSM